MHVSDSKGRSLALVLYPCLIQYSLRGVVPSHYEEEDACHYVSRTHCRSPAVPFARTLACMSLNVEEEKGATFLREVHWTYPQPGSYKLSVLTRSPPPPQRSNSPVGSRLQSPSARGIPRLIRTPSTTFYASERTSPRAGRAFGRRSDR
jgi:hypothetical protein